MKIVGITGGIGSGKTTVCKIFSQLSVPIFYADEEAKKILFEDKRIGEKVLKILGKEILSDGKLDKQKIADVVFADNKKLSKLNSIVHPVVQKIFLSWCKINKSQKYVLKEAAILFESGSYKDCDFVITVTAPENIRVKRVMARDKVSDKEIRQRMKNQWSDKEKTKRSDFIINNDGKLLLIPQVLNIHKKISFS